MSKEQEDPRLGSTGAGARREQAQQALPGSVALATRGGGSWLQVTPHLGFGSFPHLTCLFLGSWWNAQGKAATAAKPGIRNIRAIDTRGGLGLDFVERGIT